MPSMLRETALPCMWDNLLTHQSSFDKHLGPSQLGLHFCAVPLLRDTSSFVLSGLISRTEVRLAGLFHFFPSVKHYHNKLKCMVISFAFIFLQWMKPNIQDSSHFTGRNKRVNFFNVWKLSLSWNVRWYVLQTKDILAFKPAIQESGQFTGRKNSRSSHEMALGALIRVLKGHFTWKL